MGVIINRTLKDNDHINLHLAEKINKFESHIRYTVANNLDINVQHSVTLCGKKVTLPALSHGAGM